jgi:hypothetical protein
MLIAAVPHPDRRLVDSLPPAGAPELLGLESVTVRYGERSLLGACSAARRSR